VKLTKAHFRALENIKRHGRAVDGFGRPIRGVNGKLRAQLLKLGFINPHTESLTDAGCRALAEQEGAGRE
jgi:hypothetical protein